ncbi:uncharacterized protein HMPREF1541_07759 [Cyphellophora europaea CBS 101466]|uniref:C3H1-type domain-containing protein n=1 Tax=Cyphellophora europaea (strain CBS 101466) TaxID=1220924 RepID=W2RP87_CYPE1|nr:uncharacterized protein HMPREF1541_07759 [Cyphellophora europaea CBS 101466]ETN38135.1 hypothetical protein HMPREF1541_07759 [Cyphellophora europaea CBS 101466]
MVTCKFFLQGNCRYGQNCRFDHPGSGSSGGQSQSQNRFGPLASGNSGGSAGGNRFGGAGPTEASIVARDAPADLDPQKARPKWIFSSYGPTKTASISLMEDNEYSSEEIRLRYYQAAAAGQEAQADQEATQMYNKIDQDYQSIVNNVNNIPKFLEEGEKKRPNRHDFTNVAEFNGKKTRDEFIQQFSHGAGSAFGAPTSNAFGSGNSTNPFAKAPSSTFGQPTAASKFGTLPAFGGSDITTSTPAFGHASTPAFGQGAFGKPAMGNTGFGQPAFGSSSFGQSAQKNPFAPASASGGLGQTPSAFGQPSTTNSAFGQSPQTSTAFGQAPQTTSAFGQPSQPPSSFGQPSQPTSAFGQPSQPTSSFGQPSQPTSSFGQPSQPASAFGQPPQPTSGFGQPAQSSSGFGQPSQPTSAFGQPSQPTSSFGQPSQPSTFGKPAFGQTAQPSSTFGQNTQQSSSISTSFGQAAAPSSGFSNATNAGFGQVQGQNAGFGKTNDQDMESEPTARPNPFGARPASSAATATQPVQQQQGTAASASGGFNPVNPLLGKPAAPLHVTERLPAQDPTFDMGGRLTSFRGQSVTYIEPAPAAAFPCFIRSDTKEPERIWYPNAGNEKTLQSLNTEGKRLDFEGTPEEYTDVVKEAYRHLYETGSWKDGKLPLVPPAREMVAYDF